MIEFEQIQLHAVSALLIEERANGNLWVTYPIECGPVGIDSLVFFSSGYDAQEYCYEQSTDHDKWGVKAIDELQILVNQKLIVMKQENFEFLERQVKFTGFGEDLAVQLKEHMEKGQPDFQLSHKHKFGKDEADAVLHFRYAENTGNYYFNSYDLSVKNHKGEEQGSQKFYLGKDNNFTLKEGYNLLSGRSVNKDLVNKDNEKYNAWVKLDFKDTDEKGNYKMRHFTQNYGYNLDEVLSKHPIKQLQDENTKKELMDSLKKGNRQQITFIRDGKETKGYIEANPQFKSVTVYDQNFKRVNQVETASQNNQQSETQSAKAKQKVADEGEGSTKEKQAKKKVVKHRV